MVKVSVIIPVYNSECFIRQCLRSIINQTCRDLEILIIDDGSADHSLKICEEFRLTDERIRLFSQKNKGVSSARNYGLKKAAGDYVFFLDSDDAIHPFLLESLVQKAEEDNIELAFCTCKRQESAQMDQILSRNPEGEEDGQWIIGEKADSEEWFHRKYVRELTCIGGKLILKNSIGALQFDERMHTGEDTVFMYELASKGVRIAYYQAEWYYYRMNPQSITHYDDQRMNAEYFRKYQVIRDTEYQKNRLDTALEWERRYWGAMQEKYLMLKSSYDKDGIRKLKKMAGTEMKHPLFRRLPVKEQLFYPVFFFSNWSYYLLSKCLKMIRGRRS